MSEEIQRKADHLARYLAKTAKRIELEPCHPKVALWKRNWLDAQARLKSLKEFGMELPPAAITKPAGVKIDVPATPFDVAGG